MSIAVGSSERSALVDSINGSRNASSGGVGEVQDRFLKLLVTQLQNQDPMNPMENAELTSQLAQMSTVEGINNLNASMASLLDGYRASQSMQAASLIGHTVLAEGDVLTLAESVSGGGVNLSGPADSVVVNIYDESGQLVRSLDLGAQDAGVVRFGWDGLDNNGQAVEDGYYAMSIEATQGGKTVSNTPLTLAGVSSVVFEEGAVQVELAGLGQIDLGRVYQVY